MDVLFIINSVGNLPVLQRFFQSFVYCFRSFLQIVFIRCERFEIIFPFCYFNIVFYNFLKSFKVSIFISYSISLFVDFQSRYCSIGCRHSGTCIIDISVPQIKSLKAIQYATMSRNVPLIVNSKCTIKKKSVEPFLNIMFVYLCMVLNGCTSTN